jgi:hypothetical protein
MVQLPIPLGRTLLWMQTPGHGLLCYHQYAKGERSWAEKRNFFASTAACDTLDKQEFMVKLGNSPLLHNRSCTFSWSPTFARC